MQATVHRFDIALGRGQLVTDDGELLEFGADAFAASGLRHLRPGQRLSVEVDGMGGRVTALHLGGIGRVGQPRS